MLFFKILASCTVSVALFTPALAMGARTSDGPLVVTAKPKVVQDYRSIAVSYVDLNLANDAAVKQLNGRIRRAAYVVCDMQGGVVSLDEKMDGANCFRDTTERAAMDVQTAVARFRLNPTLAARESSSILVASR